MVVGLMVGASRRQYVERTVQAEQLLAQRFGLTPSEIERQRWPNATGLDVRCTMCWLTPWERCPFSWTRLTPSWRAATTPPGQDSWSKGLVGSPSRGWRRHARRAGTARRAGGSR